MLDKSAYYHGAAIVSVLEDINCCSIQKRERLGYVVNGRILLFLKYTAKAHSPWRFTFDQEDLEQCLTMNGKYDRVILVLVCGGDGVCAVDWKQGQDLLGSKPGWIAVARKHNHSYNVWGAQGELKKKIPLGCWPSLIFESEIEETNENVA